MITQPAQNGAGPELSTGTPAIEVDGLVREFAKGIRAVDAIDLAVWPGEIYGFLGPNAAGKSTTVLILTTQYLEEAGALADRIGIIDHGTIAAAA